MSSLGLGDRVCVEPSAANASVRALALCGSTFASAPPATGLGLTVSSAEFNSKSLLQRGGRPSSIVIADGLVYWIDVDTATVRRAPLPAGSAVSASPRP